MNIQTFAQNATWILILILIILIGVQCTPSSREKQESTGSAQKEDTPNLPVRIDQGRLEYLATLPDGRVVSMHTIHRKPEEMDQPGPPQPVVIRFSDDNGLSWTEPKVAYEHPEGKGVVSGGFPLVDPSGRLHSFSLRFFTVPKDGTEKGDSWLLHCVSEDGGQTWSTPKKIDYGHPYTGSLNSSLALSDGRILVALSYSNDFYVDSGKCLTVFSDDAGKTWQLGTDNISVPKGDFPGHPGALEPIMIELKDGRVWMIIRTQLGRFYQSFSTDRGETWTPATPTDFEAPNAPGGILRLSDGRLVFCWNDLSQYPEGKVEGSGRQYLYIAISSDDGQTWSPSKLIAQREEGENPNTNVAYPFLTETEDNHILVSYHRVGNKEGVSWWYPQVEVLRIDPDWIALLEE